MPSCLSTTSGTQHAARPTYLTCVSTREQNTTEVVINLLSVHYQQRCSFVPSAALMVNLALAAGSSAQSKADNEFMLSVQVLCACVGRNISVCLSLTNLPSLP